MNESSCKLYFFRRIIQYAIFLISLARVPKTVRALSDSFCQSYSNLTFNNKLGDDTETWAPPLLVAFPGSGSIWLRGLVEYSTGIYTGSIGLENNEDEISLPLFSAEKYCGLRMSLINCPSPEFLYFDYRGMMVVAHRRQARKCRKGVIVKPFNRVILLVRDPYVAILQSLLMNKARPTLENIAEKAIEKAKLYYSSWNKLISRMVLQMGTGYGKLVILRYESLLSSSSRVKILNDLITILDHKQMPQKRLECAFQLSTKFLPYENVFDKQLQSAYYSNVKLMDDIWNYVQPFATNLSYIKPSLSVSDTTVNQNTVDKTKPETSFEMIRSDRTMNVTDRRSYMDLVTDRKNLAGTIRCICHYGQRGFLLPEYLETFGGQLSKSSYQILRRIPPLLLSYPGSGNTWTRLLTEYGTGIFSGSIDVSDKQLQHDFVGENYCHMGVSSVKAHPVNIAYVPGNPHGVMKLLMKHHIEKCKVGFIRDFRRVIFLSRNPFDAILAEFQRSETMSHVQSLKAKYFENRDNEWHDFAIKAARHYHDSWERHIYPASLNMGPKHFHILKYENILDEKKRFAALDQVIKFIYPKVRPSFHRLACSFRLAETPKVHRQKSKNSVNASFAYHDRALVDKMWSYLKYFASNMSYAKKDFI